MTEQLSST